MVDVSEKVLDNVKKWLIKTSATWKAGVCRGQVFHLDGREVEGVDCHTACHSWVPNAFRKVCTTGGYQSWGKPLPKDADHFLVASCHSKVRSKDVCSPEACDFLVLWMARESPFSEFVLNRDDEESLTEGGVILLCGPNGLNTAQAMWVCKVLRFITEGGKAADTFMTLVKGGVDGMLAVFIASHIRSLNGTTFGYSGLEGHSTVFWNVPDADSYVAGLLARKINPGADATSGVFTRVPLVAPEHTKASAAKTLQNFCKPFKKSDGWGGYITGSGVEGDELVKQALEWENRIRGGMFQEKPVDTSSIFLDGDL